MPKSAAEMRREKLRNRQKQAIDTKDQKGLGRKSVLDWNRFTGKKPMSYKETCGVKELNVIDFLPFVVTQEWYKTLRTFSGLTTNLDVGDWDYKLELPIHRNVGENNDHIICPRLAFGQKCPRCDDMFAEYEKDDPDKKVTDALKPSWRCWYNVYDYSEENNPDGIISVWEDVSYYLFEKEILNAADEGEETVLYSDIEMGKTVEIKGKEKKLGKNPFIEAGNVEFKDRDPYDENIIEDTVSFDALVKFVPYDEFLRIHLGLDENNEPVETGDDQSEETKEKPKTNSRRRGPKTESKVEEEDDIPAWVEGDCPAGLEFGNPDMDSRGCKKCEDAAYDACVKYADAKAAMAEDAKNKAEKEEESTKEKEPVQTRRRRRS